MPVTKKRKWSDSAMEESQPRRTLRDTKKVEILNLALPEKRVPSKLFKTMIGLGVPLKSIPALDASFGKYPATDEVFVNLHKLLYGTPGMKATRKAFIKNWNGLPDQDSQKVLRAKLEKFSVAEIKKLGGFFGITGSKDVISGQLSAFLTHPGADAVKLTKSSPKSPRGRKASLRTVVKTVSKKSSSLAARESGINSLELKASELLCSFAMFAVDQSPANLLGICESLKLEENVRKLLDSWSSLPAADRKNLESGVNTVYSCYLKHFKTGNAQNEEGSDTQDADESTPRGDDISDNAYDVDEVEPCIQDTKICDNEKSPAAAIIEDTGKLKHSDENAEEQGNEKITPDETGPCENNEAPQDFSGDEEKSVVDLNVSKNEEENDDKLAKHSSTTFETSGAESSFPSNFSTEAERLVHENEKKVCEIEENLTFNEEIPSKEEGQAKNESQQDQDKVYFVSVEDPKTEME